MPSRFEHIAYGAGLPRLRSHLCLLSRSAISTAPACWSGSIRAKRHKDRYVMLSQPFAPPVAALVAGEATKWCGCSPARFLGAPLTVRQLNRAIHEAARRAGIDKRVGIPTPAAQLCHPSLGAEDRYPGHPGSARTQEARHDGALHPRRHQRDRRGDEPARPAAVTRGETARLIAARPCRVQRSSLANIFRRYGPAWRTANAPDT